MQSERAKFCLEEPRSLFQCCDPVGGWKTGLGAGTHMSGPPGHCCLILAVCWAQHSLGWVGFRAAGGGLGCCAPSVPFLCSVGIQQCQAGSVEPEGRLRLHPCGGITWGSHWREPWAWAKAKFIHRLGLFRLPSDCSGGDWPKVAPLATVVLL